MNHLSDGSKVQGEAVISALIGLAGACNNNPKTAQTDRVLLNALAQCGEKDAEQALLEEIRTEKFAVAPDCAVCRNPCGNTSDYDMDRLYTADAEVCEWKIRILQAIRKAASLLLCEPKLQTGTELLYKALLYVGNDVRVDDLRALLAELQAFRKKMERDTAI